MYQIEQQRFNHADPAFRPLLSLNCHIWSQPVAFHRYCRYVLEFPPESGLSDDNVIQLQFLNHLPRENQLEVIILTRLTDRSLPRLKAINTLDLLDVTRTEISDDGINALKAAFPDVNVPARLLKNSIE